jgi:PilZ domain
VACTRRRQTGSAIPAETVDLGPGGMCVSTSRALASDEVLRFDLSLADHPLDGEVRVLRQERYGVYALRFERLPGFVVEALQHLVAARR